MTENQTEALENLKMLQEDIALKLYEIDEIIQHEFPDEYPHADSYWLSAAKHAIEGDPNPHNSSLMTFLEDIEEDEEEDDEEEVA